MSPGSRHEHFTNLAPLIVRALGCCVGRSVPRNGARQQAGARDEAARAVEADSSFYLSPEKLAAARPNPKDDADWPLPDLAIEIDMRTSQLDRAGVYAALGVPEVWSFDGEALEIDRLGPDGRYQPSATSLWLGVRGEEVVHLMTLYDDAEDDNDFSARVVAWAREVLVPRREVNG